MRLSVLCTNEEAARGLLAVLGPDNRGVPLGQKFSMEARSESIDFEIASRDAASAFATLGGLLSDVALFQEIWLLSRGLTSGGKRR